MPRYREWDLACKVYVGNLGSSASKYEIENAFSKYGPLRNVWVARNPPGFAFVEFEDRRDAEDATRGLDGTRCCGTRIRVEMSSGRSRRDNRRRGGTSSGGRGGGGESSSGGRGGGGRYRIKTTSASTTTTSTCTRSTSTTTNSSSYYNKPINNFNNNDYKFYFYCYNNRNNLTKTIPFIKTTNTINKNDHNNTKQFKHNSSSNYTTLGKLQIIISIKILFISLIAYTIFNIHLIFNIVKIYYHSHTTTLTFFVGKLLTIKWNVVVVVVVCKQNHQNFNNHQNHYHHHNQHHLKHLYNCSRLLQRYCCTSKSSTSPLIILYYPSSATSTLNVSSTSVATIKSTDKTSIITTKNIKTITNKTTSATTTITSNIINSPLFNSSQNIFINNNTTTRTTSTTTTTTKTTTVKIFVNQLVLQLVQLQMLQLNVVFYWSSTAASVGFLACLSLPNNISTTQLAAVFFQQLLQPPLLLQSTTTITIISFKKVSSFSPIYKKQSKHFNQQALFQKINFNNEIYHHHITLT